MPGVGADLLPFAACSHNVQAAHPDRQPVAVAEPYAPDVVGPVGGHLAVLDPDHGAVAGQPDRHGNYPGHGRQDHPARLPSQCAHAAARRQQPEEPGEDPRQPERGPHLEVHDQAIAARFDIKLNRTWARAIFVEPSSGLPGVDESHAGALEVFEVACSHDRTVGPADRGNHRVADLNRPPCSPPNGDH